MTKYLQDIINHIKKNHPWFSDVHGPAWFDETTGKLIYGNNIDYKETGIDDRLGNYAYLRYDGNIRYGTAPQSQMLPCIGSTRKRLTATIVAVLYDGDQLKLEEALTNSLLSWQKNGSFCELTTAQVIASKVLDEELQFLPEDVQEIAMRNIDRYTLVSISFNVVSDQYSVSAKCPCNPCNY